MELDDRLQAAADFVAEGALFADIGTDHAALVIDLVKKGRIKKAVATDLNANPCEMAERQIRLNGLSEKIEVRQGNGLAALNVGEVDTVCLAGMGGELMIRILSDGAEIMSGLSNLILQPMNDAFILRRWLYEHSWHIPKEKLTAVGGHIYVILSAYPGKRPRPTELELYLGTALIKTRPPLFNEYVREKLFKLKRISNGMEKSSQATKTAKFSAVQSLINELEAILT